MLSVNELSIQRSGKYLLEASNVVVTSSSRVAVVGANGCGKSTLFSLLQGELSADHGTISLPAGTRISHMAQETPALHRPAVDFVLDGDQLFRNTQEALLHAEKRGDGMAVARCHQGMEDIDGYSAPLRARKLLEGLGITEGLHQKPVADFSGGWRVRLNLAQALMCPSDLLLLDEPTNHLDLDALVWLENWLLRYSGTLIFISHDRDFIDRLATHVLHFEQQKLTLYKGDFNQFEVARVARLAQMQQMYQKQQTRITEIQDFVRRFGAKATKARQAQSRLKELARLAEIAPAHVDSPFSFAIPCSDNLSSPLLVLDDAVIGYADRVVLHKVSLSLLPGVRLGILGGNGQGKSTLVKALAGELSLSAGSRIAGEQLSIGYFAQHQLEKLDTGLTPLQMLQKDKPAATEQEIRNFLGGFGFPGSQVLTMPLHFSGGERARLALAIIAWQQPNLLLLDEPTNHLDLEMRHALNVALQDYPGAVIIVSHDRHLLRAMADSYIWVHDGVLEDYDGSLEDYESCLLERLKAGQPKTHASALVGHDVSSSQQSENKRLRKRLEAEKRQRSAPLKKHLAALEKTLNELTAQEAEIEASLADPSMYDGDNKLALKALLKDRQLLKASVEETEAQWITCMEEIEQLSAEKQL